MLGGTGGSTQSPGFDPALLGRIAQVMSSLSTPDRDTQLLMALQPFCGEHRRKKVEEALTKAIEQAKAASIDLPELVEMLTLLYEE